MSTGCLEGFANGTWKPDQRVIDELWTTTIRNGRAVVLCGVCKKSCGNPANALKRCGADAAPLCMQCYAEAHVEHRDVPAQSTNPGFWQVQDESGGDGGGGDGDEAGSSGTSGEPGSSGTGTGIGTEVSEASGEGCVNRLFGQDGAFVTGFVNSGVGAKGLRIVPRLGHDPAVKPSTGVASSISADDTPAACIACGHNGPAQCTCRCDGCGEFVAHCTCPGDGERELPKHSIEAEVRALLSPQTSSEDAASSPVADGRASASHGNAYSASGVRPSSRGANRKRPIDMLFED